MNYSISIISLAVLIHLPGSVAAGCYNNEDGAFPAREFEICLEDNCFTDVLEYECANVHWSGAGFASGFNVSCSSETDGKEYSANTKPSVCSFSIGYFEMPIEIREKVSCEAKKEDDTGCMWYKLLKL